MSDAAHAFQGKKHKQRERLRTKPQALHPEQLPDEVEAERPSRPQPEKQHKVCCRSLASCWHEACCNLPSCMCVLRLAPNSGLCNWHAWHCAGAYITWYICSFALLIPSYLGLCRPYSIMPLRPTYQCRQKQLQRVMNGNPRCGMQLSNGATPAFELGQRDSGGKRAPWVVSDPLLPGRSPHQASQSSRELSPLPAGNSREVLYMLADLGHVDDVLLLHATLEPLAP